MNKQHTITFQVKHSLLLFFVYIFKCVLVLDLTFLFGCDGATPVLFFQSIHYGGYTGHLVKIFSDGVFKWF